MPSLVLNGGAPADLKHLQPNRTAHTVFRGQYDSNHPCTANGRS
jgi:hypothetical protein